MKKTDLETLLKPFKYGFKRELVYRATSNQKVAADAYYYDSAGHKMRSMPDVLAYLGKHPDMDLSTENFSFRRVAIHKPPQEVVRRAKANVRTIVPASPPPVPKPEGKRGAKKRCYCCDMPDAVPCRKRRKLSKEKRTAGTRLRIVAGKTTPHSPGSTQLPEASLNGSKDNRILGCIVTTAEKTVADYSTFVGKTSADKTSVDKTCIDKTSADNTSVVKTSVNKVFVPTTSGLPTSVFQTSILKTSVLKTSVLKTTMKPPSAPATPVKQSEQIRARVVSFQNEKKSPSPSSNSEARKAGGSTLRTYSRRVLNASELLEGPVLKELDDPMSNSPTKMPPGVTKVVPMHMCDHLQGNGLKQWWKVANKSLPKTEAAQELCSVHCGQAKGQCPSLQCSKCLCLFHPVCVKEEIGEDFVCKACQKKEGALGGKPNMATNLEATAARRRELRIPVLTSQPPSTVSSTGTLVGTVLTTTKGSNRSFPAILPNMVLSVPSMTPSPSPSFFSVPPTTLVNAPYTQIVGSFPPSAPIRYAIISPHMSVPIHFPLQQSSPTIFLSPATSSPVGTSQTTVSCAKTHVTASPSVLYSVGSFGTVPSVALPSVAVSSKAVTSTLTTHSPLAHSNGVLNPQPASVGLLRPSCPNITIVPGRFPATTCLRHVQPSALTSDATGSTLLPLVQRVGQQPTMPRQMTTTTGAPLPAVYGDSSASILFMVDEKPVHLSVAKDEEVAAESTTLCTQAVVGSGGIVSGLSVSPAAPLVDMSLLKAEQEVLPDADSSTPQPTQASSTAQTTQARSNNIPLSNQSASANTSDEAPRDDRKDPSVILGAGTENYDLVEEHPILVEPKSELPEVNELSSQECAASQLLQGLSKLCTYQDSASTHASVKELRSSATLPSIAGSSHRSEPSDSSCSAPGSTRESADAAVQGQCESRPGPEAAASEFPCGTRELPIWVVTPTSAVCVRSCPGSVPVESVPRGRNGERSALASLTGCASLLNRIFSFLPVTSLCRVATVCWNWNLLSKHPNLWRHVNLRDVSVTDWGTCTMVLKQMRTSSLVVEGSFLNHLLPWAERLEQVRSLSLHGASPADLATVVELFPWMSSLSANELTKPQHCQGAVASRDSVLFGELQALVGLPNLQSLRLSSVGSLLLCPWVAPKETAEQRFLAIRTLSVTTLKCSSLESFVSLKCLPHLEDLELGDCTSWTNQSYLELAQLAKLKCLSLIRGEDQTAFRYVLLKLQKLEVLRLKCWAFRASIGELLAQLPRLQQLLVWPHQQDLATNNVYALRSCLVLSTLRLLSWVVDCGGSVSSCLATSLEVPVALNAVCDCAVSQSPSTRCGCHLLEESVKGEDDTSLRWLTAGQLSSILRQNLGNGTTVCVSLRVGF